jgi:hypothetical protein
LSIHITGIVSLSGDPMVRAFRTDEPELHNFLLLKLEEYCFTAMAVTASLVV